MTHGAAENGRIRISRRSRSRANAVPVSCCRRKLNAIIGFTACVPRSTISTRGRIAAPRARTSYTRATNRPRCAMTSINGDLSVIALADTRSMEWTPSPSRTVWRKRVHLVGPPESGQVTSVVRYEPGATFPAHGHPDGEEILVLEGVFSDEHGDWPAGTYLLNPDGFRHAPFSREGCTLLVKLRQFPGRDRMHVAIRTDSLPWQSGPAPGIEIKPLYAQADYSDTVQLERWAAGAELGTLVHPEGA